MGRRRTLSRSLRLTRVLRWGSLAGGIDDGDPYGFHLDSAVEAIKHRREFADTGQPSTMPCVNTLPVGQRGAPKPLQLECRIQGGRGQRLN